MVDAASDPMIQSHTITWLKPERSVRDLQSLSGLEFVRSMAGGGPARAPFAAALGLEIDTVEEGRVVFAMTPSELHYNPIGSVHGGVIATLLDSAMGCAVHTTLPAGTGYTTLDFTVNIVRAIRIDTGRVQCEGRVLHVGGRVATAEARVTDSAGTLYAHSITTCMVMRPSSPSSTV